MATGVLAKMTGILHKLLRKGYLWLRPDALANALTLSLRGIEYGFQPVVEYLPAGTRALVLAPHADDETIGCGGTIRKLRENGIPVKVVFVSDGGRGGRELRAMPDEHPEKAKLTESLVRRRREEAEAAIKVLGVEEHEFFGLPDGELRAHRLRLRDMLLEQFKAWRPDACYMPFISDRHLDHQAVAVATLEAIGAASEPLRRGMNLYAYEVWSPLYPKIIVNVSAQIEIKRKALQEYASQLADTDYRNAVIGLNQYRSISGLGGTGYAEAFYTGSYVEFMSLYREARL